MKIQRNNLKKLLNVIPLTMTLLIFTLSTTVFAAPAGDWGRLSVVGYGYRTSGVNVSAVQQICTDAGFGSTVGNIDGSFGPKTYTALKDYQSTHNLENDGFAGPQTWNVMHSGLQYVYSNPTDAMYEYFKYDEGYGGSIAFSYNCSNGCWSYETGDIDGWPIYTELEVG